MLIPVFLLAMVIVLEENVFVGAITRKGHCCYSEAWESALETVVSSEGTRVPPRFAAEVPISSILCRRDQKQSHTLWPKDYSQACLKTQRICGHRSQSG